MKTFKELLIFVQSYIRYNDPALSKVRRAITVQVEMVARSEESGGCIPHQLMGIIANHNLQDSFKATVAQHHKEVAMKLSNSDTVVETIIDCMSDYRFSTRASKVTLKKLVDLYLPALNKLPVMGKVNVFCSIDNGSRRGLLALLKERNIISSGELAAIPNHSLTQKQAKAVMIMADVTPLAVMPLATPACQPYFLNKMHDPHGANMQ